MKPWSLIKTWHMMVLKLETIVAMLLFTLCNLLFQALRYYKCFLKLCLWIFEQRCSISNWIILILSIIFVVIVTLGLRPMQGLATLRAKREAHKSHLVLPRVQKSVREWTFTFPSELPLWELKSQMDSWIFKT
jgi:hypothetical protein